MAELSQELPERPSFLQSVSSGIGGFIRGALAGGLTGGLIGGIVGAAVLGIAILTGLSTAAPIALLGTAATGAVIGAGALAAIGGSAGTVTAIVKGREAGQPSAEDIVNVAKVSFAQGVSLGQKAEHDQHVAHGSHATKQDHAQQISTERSTAIAMAASQSMH